MEKRAVFAHLSGLRQIGGVITFDAITDIPATIVTAEGTYAFVTIQPRYVLYQEVATLSLVL